MEQLYRCVPSFQVVGRQAYHPGLENMLEFDSLLGKPHNNFKSIHIAGTNGKGSVAHMLASILSGQGYKTGLYTSPHLTDFRERIKVDSQMIPKEDVVSFLEKWNSFIQSNHPSFFEISTAMAFDYFSKCHVDIAVIETGLGGRLDSTNIITPILSVITSIGFDHKDILGDTLVKIAGEKAGIIKPSVPVVVGEVLPEVEDVFTECALRKESAVRYAKDEPLDKYGSVFGKMDLKGDYQRHNLKTVYASIGFLQDYIKDYGKVADSICNAAAFTGLRGRWETLSRKPLTICDIAHNPHGLAPVMEQLAAVCSERRDSKLYMIFGVMADKEIFAIAPLLPKEAFYYFTQASSARALPSEALKEIMKGYNLIGESTLSIEDAVSKCRESAGAGDIVYIGGSSYVVAEAINFYKKL